MPQPTAPPFSPIRCVFSFLMWPFTAVSWVQTLSSLWQLPRFGSIWHAVYSWAKLCVTDIISLLVKLNMTTPYIYEVWISHDGECKFVVIWSVILWNSRCVLLFSNNVLPSSSEQKSFTWHHNPEDSNLLYAFDTTVHIFFSLFHHAFRFTKFYLYQRMHLFLSYTKIT